MARPPGYVEKLKRPGEVARLINGTWYLSIRKSRRVRGTKIPEVYYENVAIASPSGRVELANIVRPTLGDFRCYEFGYSYVLKSLIPAKWKAHLKDAWESIFLDLIQEISPTSYLLKDIVSIVIPEDAPRKSLQKTRFWKDLSPGMNEQLQPLKQIQIAYYPDNTCVISKPSDAAAKVLFDLCVELEGCVL